MNWLKDRVRVLKNTFGSKKKMWGYFVNIAAVFGAISGIVDILQFLFPKVDFGISFICGGLILAGIIIIPYFWYRKPLNWVRTLTDSDIKIQLIVRDIFKTKADAFVIPTCTTFDTTLENEFISVHSVQGQFEEKFFNNNINELDCKIEDGLEGKSCTELHRIHTKSNRYPVGTVSAITVNRDRYYFTAIADVNENGVPENATVANISRAISGVWKEIRLCGHNESLAIPLIGTGKAGIPDAKVEDVIKMTIDSFITDTRNNTRQATNELIICIHPKDFDKIKNIDEMVTYLDYSCRFR